MEELIKIADKNGLIVAFVLVGFLEGIDNGRGALQSGPFRCGTATVVGRIPAGSRLSSNPYSSYS